MTIDRRSLLLGSLAASVTTGVAGQTRPPSTAESLWLTVPDPTETIDLWPGLPPAAPARLPIEVAHERSNDPGFNDRYFLGIARPRMAVFRPSRPNGAAALIFPGGGYRWVVVDKEGYELARWFAARGVTAFVLFYRLPAEGWGSGPDTPLVDAQRAMRLIRSRSTEYSIDPERLTALGFSAGGHVCASLLTRFAASVYQPIDAADRLSARPDGAAPIYPVISMTAPTAHVGSRAQLIGEHASEALERKYNPALHVPAGAPPAFLLHAEDDPAVPVANTLMLREGLLAAKVPVETHLYPDGGHGFGLRLSKGHSVEGWQEVLWAWGVKRRLFVA
jgi:acetyl esterase/lipase